MVTCSGVKLAGHDLNMVSLIRSEAKTLGKTLEKWLDRFCVNTLKLCHFRYSFEAVKLCRFEAAFMLMYPQFIQVAIQFSFKSYAEIIAVVFF